MVNSILSGRTLAAIAFGLLLLGSTLLPTNAERKNSTMRYVALLSQHGDDAPVAIVLENSLPAAPTWTRKQSGLYVISLEGAFPDETKIAGLREYHFFPLNAGNEIGRWRLQWNDEDENLGDSLLLETLNVTQGQYQDGLLSLTLISFAVY